MGNLCHHRIATGSVLARAVGKARETTSVVLISLLDMCTFCPIVSLTDKEGGTAWKASEGFPARPLSPRHHFSAGGRLTFRTPAPALRGQIQFRKAQPSRAASSSADSLLSHECQTPPPPPVCLLCVLLSPHALWVPRNPVPRGHRESCMQRGGEGPWGSTLRVLLGSCMGSVTEPDFADQTPVQRQNCSKFQGVGRRELNPERALPGAGPCLLEKHEAGGS